MSQDQMAEFLGGPRDGESIEVLHSVIFEPMSNIVDWYRAEEEHSTVEMIKIREYHLARRYDGKLFYVAQPMR